MSQNELKDYFKAACVRGIGTAIFSVHGKVAFNHILNVEDNTLKIIVFNVESSELEGKPNLKDYEIYRKVFKLSDDIFESKMNIPMNLETIITTVQNDLIHQT